MSKSVRQSVFEAVAAQPDSELAKAMIAEGAELPTVAATPDGQTPPPPAPAQGETPPPQGEGTAAETQPPPSGAQEQPPLAAQPPVQTTADGAPPPPPPPEKPTFDPEAYEVVEYEDPDLGEKFQVYAPKEKAQRVKDGYALKSTMSRHATFLGRHKDFLEPLITNGQFDAIRPVIERALTDPTLGDAVNEVVRRYSEGKPLTFADQQTIVAAAQAQGATPAQVDTLLDNLIDPDEFDPYTAQAISKAAAKIDQRWQQRYAELEKRVEQTQALSQQEIAARQQQQAIQQQALQTATRASQELALRFPGQFTGDLAQDESKMLPLHQYAQRAGLYQQYGVGNPAAFVVAQMELERLRAQENQPRQSAASPLAQAHAAAQQAGAEIARRAAATVVNGNAAAPPGRPQPTPTELLQRAAYKADGGVERDVRKVARTAAQLLEAAERQGG